LRLPALAGLLVLSACSGGTGAAPEPEGEMISCAIGTASEFAETCTVEREQVDGHLALVIHHEDGGFRRLTVMTDGSGVIASDGADPARITVYDGQIEVAVGMDRYILPATISGSDAQ
jgi:hypothetical protein